MELGSNQRSKRSIASIKPSDRPKQLKEGRSGSTVNGLSRSKSLRKDLSHPISSQGREIILQCFENPHSEFGNKVLQRIFEKRADYQKYVYTLGKERAYQMSIRLKDLVEEVVSKIFDPDHICSVSRTYGEEHNGGTATNPNENERTRPHHPAVRSVSMYAVASSNGTVRRTNGSVNVMAPVDTPARSTPAISRQLSCDHIRPNPVDSNTGVRSNTSPINRPRPIFE
nr:CRE-GLB-11 protein [Haemonchus contortus]